MIRKEINYECKALFLSSYNERISITRISRIIKDSIIMIYPNEYKKIKARNLTEIEINKLINNYNNNCKQTDIRNNAILHLFLNCGLRLSEVLNLNIEDIDLNEDKFRIMGKGNKERIGYLNTNTKVALVEYLKIRTAMDTKTNALFLSNYNKRISATSLGRIVKTAYLLANIENEKYSVHTLRHTCATLLYRAGIHIKTIQALLGHVRIDTTEIYTHLYNKDVEDAILGHPLSKFKIKNAMAFVC